MKINEVRLYKTQLDNSYRNVIDFHNFTKTGVNITDDVMNAADIKKTRFRYFNSLSYLELTLGAGIKSVKVEGNFITITVSGLWENIRDYNYITLRLKNTALRDVEYTSETYCFISSYTSNNDSDNPSTTIVCEIDYWTTYIDDILLNTPTQNERYAHTDPIDYNSYNDDRLPQNFITRNEYDYFIDDAILFMVMDVDADHSPITSSIADTTYKFDTAATTFTRIYVPVLALQRDNLDNIVSKLIIGTWKDDNNMADYSTTYREHGFFGGFDSQYLYGAFFTIFTPVGVMKASQFTVSNDSKTCYLKCNGWNVGQNGVFSITVNASNVIYGYNGSKVFIFGRNTQQYLPVSNLQDEKTINNPFTYNGDINAVQSINNEIKFYQYPYRQKILVYKGQEYNITPEPNGSPFRPSTTVSFIRFNGVELRITHNNEVADTLFFSISDNDTLPTSVDAYQRYKETSMTADLLKAFGTSIVGAGVGAIAAPQVGPTALMLGASTPWINYSTNIMKVKNMPDEQSTPSSNSFDFLPTVFPRMKTKTIKGDDAGLVSAMWNKFGYPVNKIEQFTMKRFWFDYKQIKSPILSQITNALARKKLEEVLSNGVTIWHINYDGTNFKSLNIGDYSKNNPGRNNCKEET